MTDLVERLHDDVRQLTKMVEHAKLAGPETGVRVKDPSLLLADLSEAASRISQQDAELERMRRELAEAKEFRAILEGHLSAAIDDYNDALKALEPFAEAAASYDPPENDDGHAAWAHDFTIGSLRRARATIAKVKP